MTQSSTIERRLPVGHVVRRRSGMKGRTPNRVLVALALLAGGALGCAHRTCQGRDPEHIMKEYAAALRAGDADGAWALLSEETKRSTTLEAFRRELQRNRAQMSEIADQMERPVGPPLVVAQLGGPDGEAVEMIQVGGEWRLRLTSLDPYSQASPSAALRSFVRATQQRRYDVLLRLAPTEDGRAMDEAKLRRAFEGPEGEELVALSQAIEAGLGHGRLEVVGDRATFDLGAGSMVELVLQNGAWRIENYRP